jgi:hypothetical protein
VVADAPAALMTPDEIVMVVLSGLTAPKSDVVANGRSAATKARKAGAAGPPVVGPE